MILKQLKGYIFIAFLLAVATAMRPAAVVAAEEAAQAPAVQSADAFTTDIKIEDLKIDYEEIKAAYAYDHAAPLNIQIKKTKEFTGYTEYTFMYDSIDGRVVPAMLLMPKPHVKPMKKERATVAGAFPAMFFMHFHVADKTMAQLYATWPGQGLAVMAIDGLYRGDRAEEGKDIFDSDPRVFGANMKMQIQDILRGLDALASWQGIDPGRIGFMGVSMGALTGTAATALDARVKSILLADGAADFALMFNYSDYGSLQKLKKNMFENNISPAELIEALKYAEPAVFAPHLGDRPVLMLNGKKDTTMSLPAMEKLHNLVTSPNKEIKWYDSDHILPVERVVYDSLKWFKKTL